MFRMSNPRGVSFDFLLAMSFRLRPHCFMRRHVLRRTDGLGRAHHEGDAARAHHLVHEDVDRRAERDSDVVENRVTGVLQFVVQPQGRRHVSSFMLLYVQLAYIISYSPHRGNGTDSKCNQNALFAAISTTQRRMADYHSAKGVWYNTRILDEAFTNRHIPHNSQEKSHEQ